MNNPTAFLGAPALSPRISPTPIAPETPRNSVPDPSATCPTLTRQTNTAKRHERIRAAFRERYTSQPRPRKWSREYVVAQLAEEFCLSGKTVEDIIWTKVK